MAARTPAPTGADGGRSPRPVAAAKAPLLLLALSLLHLHLPHSACGFAPTGRSTPIGKHNAGCYSNSLAATSSSDDNDETPQSQEPSSGIIEEMTSPTNEAYSRYTHLIAIPLETNHDLMLELESVQRAVLYHCPLLINACLTPELTRMPLLYVDASSADDGAGGRGGAGERASTDDKEVSAAELLGGKDIFSIMRNEGSGGGTIKSGGDKQGSLSSFGGRCHDPITAELHSIVENVIQEQIYSRTTTPTDAEEDQAEPILMSFKGLEMDGDANEVLHVIGTEESSGTATLRSILKEIQRRVEAKGWTIALPPDEPQGGISSSSSDDVSSGGNFASASQWRPRVPFMRLPANFEASLPPPKGTDGKYESYSEEEKARYVRQPEEGGNGISPIFWYRWWEDDFPAETVDNQGIRLREVAVYERTAEFGATENAFYIPHLRVDLPGAGKALDQKEKQDAHDAMKRMKEKEEAFGGPDGSTGMDFDKLKDVVLGEDRSAFDSSSGEEQYTYEETDRRMMEALEEGGILWEGTKSIEGKSFDKTGALNEDGASFDRDALDVPRFDSMDDEMRAARTDSERRMVQTMYDKSPSDASTGVEFVDVQSVKSPDGSTTSSDPAMPALTSGEDFAVAAARAAVEKRRRDGSRVDPEENGSTSSSANAPDDEAKKREIVEKIRKPIATGDWSSAKPKDKVPWQDNPVFKDWQSRVTMAEDDGPAVETKSLPPFPSHEHFVGSWRMVSSPTSAFDGVAMFGEDSSMSENLILRVDGLTAGGPILDMQNMQRAAGGTWKFFEAERVRKAGDNEDEEVERQTRLRVRLVVPPKKDRILCMEGHAQLVSSSAIGAKSIDASSMIAPGTFGIPQAEEVKKKADQARAERIGTDVSLGDNEAREDVLRCSGEVWIEDARTGDNRKKIGRFVMEKERISDPSKLVYTIPRPTRIQD